MTKTSHASASGPTRAAVAAGAGAVTAVWYALPDVVRSRAARGWIKTVLTVGTAAWVLAFDALESDPATAPAKGAKRAKVATKAKGAKAKGAKAKCARKNARAAAEEYPVALGVGAVAFLGVTTALTVALERWLFARGERRRLGGVRWAHTRQGVALGVLGAVAALCDPPAKQKVQPSRSARARRWRINTIW